MENLCPCFGRQLRQFRDEADISLERLAVLTDTPVGTVDEVERGRRAVVVEWVRLADRALNAGGMLCAEAADCLGYHAGMVDTDPLGQHTADRTTPIRLPGEFIAAAA